MTCYHRLLNTLNYGLKAVKPTAVENVLLVGVSTACECAVNN